jgi:hypothetical protein
MKRCKGRKEEKTRILTTEYTESTERREESLKAFQQIGTTVFL